MSNINKKVVLVTGGAGFIGSHLCRKLLKLGNYVICMDNCCSGNINNIQDCFNNVDFEFKEHNVISPYDFYVDEVYNLACPASPQQYQKDRIFTFKTCILGAINALELANKYNAKILQASTSEVYGDALKHPQNELYWGNVNCNGVRACYDEGKRGAETIFCDYNRQYKTRIKIVRIFNTYGPNMLKDDGRVVSNFIVAALKHSDIFIYGNGKQTRSFNYISDLIEALILIMKTDDSVNSPINIGNPNEITIEELAKIIINKTKSKSKIIHKESATDDPKQRKPDISLACSLLNWKPKITLYEGLDKTIEYFRNKIALEQK